MIRMRHWHHPTRRRNRLAVVAAVVAALSGCASFVAAVPASDVEQRDERRADVPSLGFAVVGDSISAGSQPVEGRQVRGTGSWVPAADTDPLVFRGGWAVPGATTADMRAGVQPVEVEAVVVMGGTNDLVNDVPWDVSRENLISVVDTVGAPDVLLSAVPPIDARPTAATAYNTHLERLAEERGWAFGDPWAWVRLEGRFIQGASPDGVHPTVEVAGQVGSRIRETLLAGGGG
jgi:hypothetical protein